jgi:DtxR family Mn-dependent transcriptional regulator
MEQSNELTDKLEDYLKVILALEQTDKVARPKDIAGRMKVQPPSVTNALRGLKQRKLINHKPYGYVTLTRKGSKIARKLSKRHAVIMDLLLNVLKVDKKTADITACRLEHVIDNQTLKKLSGFIAHYKDAEA